MASNPTFDPPIFVERHRPEVFQRLQDPAHHAPLNNRAIQGLYSPGSTFKLMTSLAGDDEGADLAPNTTVDDRAYRSNCSATCVFRNAGGDRRTAG